MYLSLFSLSSYYLSIHPSFMYGIPFVFFFLFISLFLLSCNLKKSRIHKQNNITNVLKPSDVYSIKFQFLKL